MFYSRSVDELCRLGTKYALCPEMAKPFFLVDEKFVNEYKQNQSR